MCPLGRRVIAFKSRKSPLGLREVASGDAKVVLQFESQRPINLKVALSLG